MASRWPTIRLLLTRLPDRLPTGLAQHPTLKALGVMPLYETSLAQLSDDKLAELVGGILHFAQELQTAVVHDLESRDVLGP
jgi:hypothetical protein